MTSKTERRKRIWERHFLRGESRGEVISEVAAEFDIEEETVESDLSSFDSWLPDLEIYRDRNGLALVVELRANRQQLHQLADQARNDDEFVQERKVRQEINRSINFERQLHDASMQTKAKLSVADEIRRFNE